MFLISLEADAVLQLSPRRPLIHMLVLVPERTKTTMGTVNVPKSLLSTKKIPYPPTNHLALTFILE